MASGRTDLVRLSSSPLYMTSHLDWTDGNKLMQFCWISARLLIRFLNSALQSSSITMASETKTYPGSKVFSRIEISKWSLGRHHLVLLSQPESHRAQCLDLSCSWYTSMTCPQEFPLQCNFLLTIVYCTEPYETNRMQCHYRQILIIYRNGKESVNCFFNPDKCEHIRITNKRKVIQTSYNIHGQTMNQTSKAKYFGVTIDNTLSVLEQPYRYSDEKGQSGYSLPP